MEQNERAVYVISVAAELAGVHPQTLRIYERKGLIEPQRTQGRREPRRAFTGLGPGVAPLAVHHGWQIAEDLGAALDEADGRQRHEVGRAAIEMLFVDVGHLRFDGQVGVRERVNRRTTGAWREAPCPGQGKPGCPPSWWAPINTALPLPGSRRVGPDLPDDLASSTGSPLRPSSPPGPALTPR